MGQKRTWRSETVMSALPPKADIRPRDQDVRFGPVAEVSVFNFVRWLCSGRGSFLIQPLLLRLAP